MDYDGGEFKVKRKGKSVVVSKKTIAKLLCSRGDERGAGLNRAREGGEKNMPHILHILPRYPLN